MFLKTFKNVGLKVRTKLYFSKLHVPVDSILIQPYVPAGKDLPG